MYKSLNTRARSGLRNHLVWFSHFIDDDAEVQEFPEGRWWAVTDLELDSRDPVCQSRALPTCWLYCGHTVSCANTRFCFHWRAVSDWSLLMLFEWISFINGLFSLKPGFTLWRKRLHYLSPPICNPHFLFNFSASQLLLGAFNFQALSVIESICLPFHHFCFCLLLHILFIFIVIRYFICWTLFSFVTYHSILLFSFSLRLILSNVFFSYYFSQGNKEEIQERGRKHPFCKEWKANLSLAGTVSSFFFIFFIL